MIRTSVSTPTQSKYQKRSMGGCKASTHIQGSRGWRWEGVGKVTTIPNSDKTLVRLFVLV